MTFRNQLSVALFALAPALVNLLFAGTTGKVIWYDCSREAPFDAPQLFSEFVNQ